MTSSDFSVQALSDSLSEHAAHLHSLYASLGASPDPVPAKMRFLQERLALCVQEQRTEAEQEVAAVHEQLEQLQSDLVTLAGLLGCKLSPDSDQEALVTTLANRRAALETLHQLRDERQAHASALTADLCSVSETLGTEPPAIVHEKSLSLMRITALTECLDKARMEQDRRQAQLTEMLQEIQELQADLHCGLTEDESGLLDSNGDVPATPAVLEQAARLQDRLTQERSEREAAIQEAYDALYALWAMAGTSEDEADAFVDQHAGITDQCIEAYQSELARMRQWQREHIAEWVQAEVDSLKQVKLSLYDLPRPEGKLWLDGVTDELLQLQQQAEEQDEAEAEEEVYGCEAGREEEYLEELAQQKEELAAEAELKSELLSLVDSYFALHREAKALEASANDKSRLTGKGVRGDPGRLLREEKMRKRIAKEKPKIEAELQKKIPPWEAEHGPFTIFRERLLDLLAEVSVKARAPSRGGAARPPPASAHTNGHSMNRSANASTVSSQASGHSRTTVKRHPQASTSRAPPQTQSQTSSSSIPAKRIRTNSASQSSNASRVATNSTTGTRRGSFKPRPSDISTSTRAPSSLFSAPNGAVTRDTGSRTSAASSIVALLEEEDDDDDDEC